MDLTPSPPGGHSDMDLTPSSPGDLPSGRPVAGHASGGHVARGHAVGGRVVRGRAPGARSLDGLTVVLPAFNEAANLEATVRELLPVVAAAAGTVEVVVVDDGSADDTADVAARLAAEAARAGGPSVRVVRHPRNLGYGAALRTGFAAARQPWILLLDADGQFVPHDLERFVAAAAAADLVAGYRVRRADPPHRRAFAWAWRWLMRALLGVRVRDVDCAFKLVRTGLVQSLALEAGGAFISAELLAKAGRCGARIVEVPVAHRPRRAGQQTGGRVRVLVRAFYELARLWRRVRRFPGDAGRGPRTGSGR
jgi:glycosyltransferase involved in cell wall biosynthesis